MWTGIQKGLTGVFLAWGLWNSKRLEQLGIGWASLKAVSVTFPVIFPHGLNWASSQHGGLKAVELLTWWL